MAALDVGLQSMTDGEGAMVGVLVPIALWRDIESERETAHLLKSEAIRRRSLAAKDGAGGISLEDARVKLAL